MAEPNVSYAKKTFTRNPVSTEQEYAKLPPQVKELEDAVIGAIMLDNEAMHDVIEILKPESFYINANQLIWNAAHHLYHLHQPIDILTIAEQLRKTGELESVGGMGYLMQVSSTVSSSANIEYHARVIQEKHVARKLIAIGNSTIKGAYEETTDIFDLVNHTAGEVENINLSLVGQGQKNFGDTLVSVISDMRKAAESKNYMTGVKTFSDVLDGQLLGLQPENLVIIAGRPGMGKTSVAWHIALNQAKNGIPVGFFTLEMSDTELIRKMISAHIRVDSKTVRKGGLKYDEWQRLDSALQTMINYPIYTNDTAGIQLNQLLAVGRNWVRKQGVKVIYIDYIGKIRTGMKFGTREQEVSHISGTLKDFAKQMKVPVVLLSQLSRAVEQRGGDKRPLLSDLRESGSVEQDADIVIFPYRPEYYGITESPDIGILPKGYTELDIQKFREGEPVAVRWIFEAEYSSFKDYNPF
jgi:replicative DNA helicase